MTENEAIDFLQHLLGYENAVNKGELNAPNAITSQEKEALEYILEEIEQYRALGTVEELREAMEKQRAKKPCIWGDGYSDGKLVYDSWDCPNCGDTFEIDYEQYDYCPHCGQAIGWGEEE